MKRAIFSTAILISTLVTNAQNGTFSKALTLLPAKEEKAAAPVSSRFKTLNKQSSTPIIWSEDFSNGIPTTWGNNGSSTSALWEYRGSSTTPGINTGSRGGYAGAGTPIQSATRANGFVIFDSGFLDNGGIAGNQGNGTAPAPHTGRLTTPTINLSGHSDVELKFTSYARQFQAIFMVAISIDNGLSWPDTLHFYSHLPLGRSSPTNDELSRNISSIVGGQTQVKFQFIFDSKPVGGLSGYYFWMLDDIELRTAPRHELRFIRTGSKPAVSYEPQPAGSVPYGIWHLSQTRPIGGSAGLLNYGASAQTGVKVDMQVFDAQMNLITTLSTPTVSSLASQDTVLPSLSSLTGTWTPTSPGDYTLVYSAISDSVGPAKPGLSVTDTIEIFASSKTYGMDDKQVDNYLNTSTTLSSGLFGIGMQYDFPKGMPVPTSDSITIKGVEIQFSPIMNGLNSDIQIEVYDTAGFSYTGGFGATALHSQVYPLDSINPSAPVSFYFSGGTVGADGLRLQKRSYFIVVWLFAGPSPILIGNSQTWAIPGPSTIMYSMNDARWYSGFQNSRTFNAPMVRAILGNDFCPTDTFSTTVTACGSYQPPGSSNTYTRTGIYYDTLTSSGGCDSLVLFDLTVLPNPTGSLSVTHCGPYTSASGRVYQSSGVFVDTLSSAGTGCDSLVTLSLSLVSSYTTNLTAHTCSAYTSPTGNYVWTTSGAYSDTLQSTQGCDSILLINLTVETVNTGISQSNAMLTAMANVATFQWLNCDTDSIIIGQTGRTFVLSANGNYAVIVTQNGCIDTSSCVLVTSIGKDEPEHIAPGITVYPNPSHDCFYLQLSPRYKGATIKVYDLSGKLVLEKELKQTQTKLEIRKKGTYLLELFDGNKIIDKVKLVKS